MISTLEAREVALSFLRNTKRKYIEVDSIEKIVLEPNSMIANSKYIDKFDDIYSVGYGVYVGNEIVSYFIEISARTGEIYGILSPKIGRASC